MNRQIRINKKTKKNEQKRKPNKERYEDDSQTQTQQTRECASGVCAVAQCSGAPMVTFLLPNTFRRRNEIVYIDTIQLQPRKQINKTLDLIYKLKMKKEDSEEGNTTNTSLCV